MCCYKNAILFVAILICLSSKSIVCAWAPTAWVPNTTGWHRLMNRRYEQIHRIQSSQERWDASIYLAISGHIVKNFTKTGFAVVRQPKGVHRRLKRRLKDAFDGVRRKKPNSDLISGLNREIPVDQISGERPGMVPLGKLKSELLKELTKMHETWAGVKLVPTTAYGLRIYVNGNRLTMHTDHVESHVISSILHVARDVDEPWPLVIEGFDGSTAEVDLRPGEMLFYESAKCVHGRPRPLKGRFYTSLFMHYKPVGWSVSTESAKHMIERSFSRQAKRWNTSHGNRLAAPLSLQLPVLQMVGTGMKEPGCENDWCALQQQVVRENMQINIHQGQLPMDPRVHYTDNDEL